MELPATRDFPLAPETDPGASFGLDIVVEREFLRQVNLTTGTPYLTTEEAGSVLLAERERAETARERPRRWRSSSVRCSNASIGSAADYPEASRQAPRATQSSGWSATRTLTPRSRSSMVSSPTNRAAPPVSTMPRS